MPRLRHEALPWVMCRCRVINVIGHSTLLKMASAESVACLGCQSFGSAIMPVAWVADVILSPLAAAPKLAWENSRHLAALPLFSPPNDVWETSAEIPYRVGNLTQPIRSTTQIWVVTRHQYVISALVTQTSFGGKTSGSVAKCRLFPRLRRTSCFRPQTDLIIGRVFGFPFNPNGPIMARTQSWYTAGAQKALKSSQD